MTTTDDGDRRVAVALHDLRRRGEAVAIAYSELQRVVWPI